MAKKSEARQKRDKQGLPPLSRNPHQATDAQEKAMAELDGAMNTCWDDLHTTYHRSLTAFAGMGLLGRTVNDPELLIHVQDRRGFIDRVKLLTHDMGTLKVDLDAIFALHKDRTGGKSGGDDLFAAIEISEHYQQWALRYEGLIQRNLNEILAITGEAEKLMYAARAKAQQDADLTNPAVVSDVAFTEAAGGDTTTITQE